MRDLQTSGVHNLRSRPTMFHDIWRRNTRSFFYDVEAPSRNFSTRQFHGDIRTGYSMPRQIFRECRVHIPRIPSTFHGYKVRPCIPSSGAGIISSMNIEHSGPVGANHPKYMCLVGLADGVCSSMPMVDFLVGHFPLHRRILSSRAICEACSPRI